MAAHVRCWDGSGLASEYPAGAWNKKTVTNALDTLVPAAAVAHRGNFGLRLTDGWDTAGAGPGTFAQQYVATSPNQYVRYWFRVNASNGQGRLALDASSGPVLAPRSFYFDGALTQVQSGGVDNAGAAADGLASSVDTNGWHLYEASLTGIGSANARRTTWLDARATLAASRSSRHRFSDRSSRSV